MVFAATAPRGRTRAGSAALSPTPSEPLHDEHAEHAWWYIAPPPWWSFLFGLAGATGTAVWGVITGGSGAGPALFVQRLVWPGLAIGAVLAVIVWLAWTLDLE